MNATELQFRTATFGGFQKQDVLDYIEQANQEHREKLTSLQRELEETASARTALEQERDTLRSQLEETAASSKGQIETLEEENRRLTGELEAARKEAAELREKLTGQADELAATQLELEEVQGKLKKIAPAAAAYEQVKDRTAGMELEAHCRAQAVQAAAEERVKKARAEVEQWLHRVRTGYAALRGDMDATVSQACGELDQLREKLEHISSQFADQDARLEQLAQDCVSELGPRAPEPLPLNEQ